MLFRSVKQASCSELIKFPDLAKEIVAATKEASNIPVSVKTRTGIKEHNTEKWISTLLETKPAAITLHARTQRMMSDFPAEWEQVKIAVELKNSILPEIPLIGNGDLFSMDDCFARLEETKADGVMIGRGIFKNPWFFNYPNKSYTKEEKLTLLVRHLALYENTWQGEKGFAIMKKFFKIYTYDFYGASEIRAKLMETKNAEEVYFILRQEGIDC